VPSRASDAARILCDTGITAYLENKELLQHAQTINNHASPCTMNLYDRRSNEISMDNREKFAI